MRFASFLAADAVFGDEVRSLWEAWASSILAPIDVPERSSWFASVRETPGCSSKERHNLTILTEKLKARSGISDFILFRSNFKLRQRTDGHFETFSSRGQILL